MLIIKERNSAVLNLLTIKGKWHVYIGNQYTSLDVKLVDVENVMNG